MSAKAAKGGSLPVRWWHALVRFIGEVKAELIKVAWPSRSEVISSTWVVIGAVAVVAVWIFFVDKVTAVSMSALIKLFG